MSQQREVERGHGRKAYIRMTFFGPDVERCIVGCTIQRGARQGGRGEGSSKPSNERRERERLKERVKERKRESECAGRTKTKKTSPNIWVYFYINRDYLRQDNSDENKAYFNVPTPL